MKNVDLDEPKLLFLINANRTKQYFCWSNWKITRVWKPSQKSCCVVLRHWKTCSQIRWKRLRIVDKEDWAVIQIFQSLLGWSSSYQEGRTWISWRILEVCSQIVLRCLYVARIGRPDILWSVIKLARSVTEWTRHKLATYVLARWISYNQHASDCNTVQHCRLCFLSRLNLCFWLWGLNIHLWESSVCFPIPNICPDQLDVWEVNVCIPQFYRIWDHFVGCCIADGWITCAWFMGCGHCSTTIIEHYPNTNQTGNGKPFARKDIQTQTGHRAAVAMEGTVDQWSNVDFRHHKRKFFSRRVFNCIFLKVTKPLQKKDDEGQKSNVETRITNTELLLIWLLDRINLESKMQNQVCWLQKPTRRHVDQRKFHTWSVESSSFDEYHEVFDGLLQPCLSFKQGAERHVKQRTGR